MLKFLNYFLDDYAVLTQKEIFMYHQTCYEILDFDFYGKHIKIFCRPNITNVFVH